MEIKDVIKHCKAGNKLAQRILFDTYYQQMYQIAMRILYNSHDVEDAIIIAFSKVFKGLDRFEYRDDHSLKKWIKTIVVNETIRLIKAKPAISYTEDLSELEDGYEYDTDKDSFDVEQVYTIIGAMPQGYRTVFNLFAIEGYSHKEIAELLDIAENTSKSQLRKARKFIIEKLKTTQEYENSQQH